MSMARIGLIDVDGHNFPNLPLMKLSAWHKQQGDLVEWYMPFSERYDKVYVSKVFSFTPDYDYWINADVVVRGGTGYCIETVDGREIFHRDKNVPLPDEVEHIYPDYSIYSAMTKDTAYGFLTRGCPRGCGFCIVGSKEGRCSVKVADLSEFWRGQKRIVLCDPNLLACKDWQDLLSQLVASKALVDFNQGLDIRLMTRAKARMLDGIKIKDIHFAWDRYEDKDDIIPKFEMFAEEFTQQPHNHNVTVYILTNYNTTLDQDLDRIYTLRLLGYWPFVMVYDRCNADNQYKRLQRWVNMRSVFMSVERFEQYNG